MKTREPLARDITQQYLYRVQVVPPAASNRTCLPSLVIEVRSSRFGTGETGLRVGLRWGGSCIGAYKVVLPAWFGLAPCVRLVSESRQPARRFLSTARLGGRRDRASHGYRMLHTTYFVVVRGTTTNAFSCQIDPLALPSSPTANPREIALFLFYNKRHKPAVMQHGQGRWAWGAARQDLSSPLRDPEDRRHRPPAPKTASVHWRDCPWGLGHSHPAPLCPNARLSFIVHGTAMNRCDEVPTMASQRRAA